MDRRRALFAFSLGCLFPSACLAQARRYIIGAVDFGSPEPTRMAWWAVFRSRLRELGFEEGRNLYIDSRFADGDHQKLASLVDALVRAKVDVIVAAGSPAALAAKTATREIPIVTTNVADPVALGLVKSLARPEGNVTGVSSLTSDLSAKRVEILKTFVPKVSYLGILSDETNPASRLAVKDAEAAARSLKIRTLPRHVSASNIEEVFKQLKSAGVNGVLAVNSPAMYKSVPQLVKAMIAAHLPCITGAADWARAGCLISFGADYPHLFMRAAEYTARVLGGARPSDLPMELPSKYELVVNLKTAETIGVRIPEVALARADEVIR